MDLPGAPAPNLQGLRPLESHELVNQLGCEVAGKLSLALERVVALAASGRISKASLRALRDEIDGARRAGIAAQQLARLAGGRVEVQQEPVDLADLMGQVLLQRAREFEARGLEVQRQVDQAEVLSDASLVFSLLQTALDWCLEHAVAHVEVSLVVSGWPAQARVVLAFAHQPVEPSASDGSGAGGESNALNTLSWRLLQQTATTLGLALQRRDTPGRCELCLVFPDTMKPRLPVLNTAAPAWAGPEPEPALGLTGRHVLVLASRRELRSAVREALHGAGVMLDFVHSVAEAQHLCAAALPHALVYDASLAGDRFQTLRSQMLARSPRMAFVGLTAESPDADERPDGASPTAPAASVGIDDIVSRLAPTLLAELARSGRL